MTPPLVRTIGYDDLDESWKVLIEHLGEDEQAEIIRKWKEALSEPLITFNDLDATFTDLGRAYASNLTQDTLTARHPMLHLVKPPTPAEKRRARMRHRLHRLRLLWLAFVHPEELEER